MKRRDVLGFLAVLAVSCAAPPAKTPLGATDLPRAFAAAFRSEAIGDPRGASEAYLSVVDSAARAPDDPWAVAAMQAALDALATRSSADFGEAARDVALLQRVHDDGRVMLALARAATEARGPFARGLIARALLDVAERRDDPAAAETWRGASGCAREALVIGPTTWAPVTGVDEPSPFDHADARIESSYATPDVFDRAASGVVVRDRGCAIDLSAGSSRPGVREVAIDVDVPREQWIGVVLRAHGAARLRAGGVEVVRRPFELGDGEAARFALVKASRGALRLAARVGTARDQDSVEIDVWGDDGRPLTSRAPAVGTVAGGRALGSSTVAPPVPRGGEQTLLAASAALAAGDSREAERMLWPAASRSNSPPDLGLLYGRALESARDLSAAIRAQRGRDVFEHVLEAWPESWEAVVAHAVLAGVRRGRDEGGIEALRDLDATRARPKTSSSPMLDAFDALASGRERLFDRAHAALERTRVAFAGTPLFADVEDSVTPRTGAELVTAECDPKRGVARDTLACFDALRAAGDRARSAQELARLRTVLGAPGRFLPLELRDALDVGDKAVAARAFSQMLPAERTLAARVALDSPAAGARWLAEASDARDAPGAIAPLLRETGEDPARPFEGIAERIAAQDRREPLMPSAATAVLAHVERYDVAASGLTHWLLFDVRRVSGTTDVEENAQAATPDVWGRGAMRALRRRIFKHDGRVLEPEHTPRASQAHADLSQLEQGDVVEAIYEGWALPGETGDIGLDSPDLLPERTAVHDATIELRLPRRLRGSLWSHPLLGKSVERTEGESRVIEWHVVDQPVRRIEDGVPKMERNASVSFSTARWPVIAQALRETMAALGEHDPEITAWAHDAAASEGGKATRATVDAVVTAVGKALREADPGTLSDYGGGIVAAQSRTARTFLTSHDGSRSWLVVRALGELAVPCEVVVAENEPYSADASFPPHFGRFAHPLVVAHLDGKEVWIDADVQGPPLPAGRISPELRGRSALHVDGTISPLPSFGGDEERDEIDLRLTLDAKGGAKGTVSVVLRGRQAQELSEAFFRIVGAERERTLRGVVLAWLPWANVDEVQLASTEGSWQVGLRADVTVGGYAQLESGKTWLLPGIDTLHWVWPQAHVSSLGATFATRAGRESALALNAAVQYHVHRRVELPKGASVSSMPGPIDVSARLVKASHKMGVADGGRVLEDDFTLDVATGTVPAPDYDAFVEVTRAVDDGFLASTRVAIP